MINKFPEYAQIGDKKYKINSDFRIAIECQKVSVSNVTDTERALAIIFLIFGDAGINDFQNWDKLLELALKFLNLGIEKNDNEDKNEEVDMDFEQDFKYIRTSFFYDYKLDLDTEKIHWWKFYELLSGLSEKCILNRVRFVRNFDISQLNNSKEKEKWIKQKELVQLKIKKPKTENEKKLDELFEKQLKGE